VRNLAYPALVSLPLAVATQVFAYNVVRGGDQNDPVPLLWSWTGHVYPTGVVVYFGWLILTALSWEVLRTVLNSSRASGRDAFGTFVRMVMFQNRRYGGYVVHAGLALLAIGVVISSVYRLTDEIRFRPQATSPGGEVAAWETAQLGKYELTVLGTQTTPPGPSQPYHSTRVSLEVAKAGTVVATLDPEKRHYPQTAFRRDPQTQTEPKIDKRDPLQDFYVYFDHADQGSYVFTVFRNPMINLVWAGWVVMVLGGVWAALPFARKRVGLAG
jgi:cytochrome c-type biogenesis protein CcmF